MLNIEIHLNFDPVGFSCGGFSFGTTGCICSVADLDSILRRLVFLGVMCTISVCIKNVFVFVCVSPYVGNITY